MTDAAPDSRPPISAYIRTKNEERMIADVVRAALAVAREVVVVDSGSTDRTIELAEAAGARVIHCAWPGFGHQKRNGEDACRYDWLLDLDADEIVTPELADEIRGVFADGEPEARIFRTPLAFVPPFGKPWRHFGVPTRRKLYDRRVVRAPAHPAWDQFAPPPGVPRGKLSEPILHYAFADFGHLTAKLNASSTAMARDAKMKSGAVIVLRIFFGVPFYFAKRYFVHGFFRAGVQGFVFSVIAAYGRWLRDVKMYERLRRERAK